MQPDTGATGMGAAQSGPKTRDQKRAEAETRQRAYRAVRDRKERFEAIDDELSRAQSRYDELVALMAKPELYADPPAFEQAMAEFNDLKSRIPPLEEEWMRLSEEIERISAEEP